MTRLGRVRPLFVLLLLTWLLLAGSWTPGSLLLGLVLAYLGCRAFNLLGGPRPELRHGGRAVRLLLVVARDVVASNVAVARVLLAPHRPQRRAGFVRVPLTARDPAVLGALACILTATPGTAWVEFNAEDGILTLHVLDLTAEEDWAQMILDRYEAPLREILG